MFVYFYPEVVSNVSRNLRETFRTFFCPGMNLSQRKVQRCYISEKHKFTAGNMCFISTNSGNYPGEISSGEKSTGKYFCQVCQISEIFSDKGTFRKIPEKISWNFINKNYNLPAADKCLHIFISRKLLLFPETVENLSGNFLSHDQRASPEFVMALHG